MVVPQGALVPPDRIELEVDEAGRRNRLTVAFRPVLILPHLVVLLILGVGAGAVAVVGWFAALVLGRLPEWAAGFLGYVLGWRARVQAYGFLLVDRYPPFRLEQREDDAVRLQLAPGRLNRLAVAFRFVLVIPAEVVATLATAGLVVLSVVVWVIVVLSGRLPQPLFQAGVSVLRYDVRLVAYAPYLLTAAYPSGLFGDPAVTAGGWRSPAPAGGAWPAPAPAWPAAAPAPTGGTAPEPSAPAGLPHALATSGEVHLLGGYDFGSALTGSTVPALSAGVVSRPARRLVALMLVIGLALAAVAGVVDGVVLPTGSPGPGVQAAFLAAHSRFAARAETQAAAIKACGTSTAPLRCQERGDRLLAQAYIGYAQDLDRLSFPTSSTRDAYVFVADLEHVASVLRLLGRAPSPSAYQAAAAQLDLTALGRRAAQDQHRLSVDLGRR